jgi:hypothetical protein
MVKKTLKNKKVDYIIAIPSYKRAETLRDKSLTVLKEYNISPKCIDIFVANKDEEEEYKKVIDPKTYKIVISKKYCMQNLEINKYIYNDMCYKLKKYPHINYYLCLKYQKFMNDQNN